MRVTVRATPAAGSSVRWRAGRPWSSEPVIVDVVEAPHGPGEITPADLAALRSDPYIIVGDALDDANTLAALEAELQELRRELAQAVEDHEADDEYRWRKWDQAPHGVAEKAARVAELERKIAALRGA